MAYTFVGIEKRIYIDPPVAPATSLDIDVQDLYSRWKDWTLEGTNLQWEAAFRTFGGDTTIQGQTAPKYFFLTNGWRVIVDGFDATFATNLYTDEGDSAVITLNGGTAQIKNSDAPIIEYVQNEIPLGYNAEYIYVAGTTGSDETGDGTLANPFATVDAARTIALSNNINKIFLLKGPINLNGVNYSNIGIYAHVPNIVVTLSDGSDFTNTSFNNVKLMGSTNLGRITCNGCDINGLSGFEGYLINTGINVGGITFRENTSNYMIDCYNSAINTNPILDFNNLGIVRVTARNFSGGIQISNMTDLEDYLSIHFTSGNCVINNSNTAGNIQIGGTVKLTDNNNGTTVNKDDTINEILGIDTGNLSVSVDEVAIANAVWSKQISELMTGEGTVGAHVSKELLTVIKYLALK